MSSPEPAQQEMAAPLDLLLVNSTKSFTRRMMPDGSWVRLAAEVAKQPAPFIGNGKVLATELLQIVAGKSDREPKRGDRRFADPAWTGNPLLKRIKQAYLATSDTVYRIHGGLELDYSDNEKVKFVIDNLVEGLAPTNNPVLSPLAWKALIDTGGLSVVRGAKAFAKDMKSKPRVPSMVEPDSFAVGETVAVTRGSVVLRTRLFELIQYAPQTEQVREIPLLVVPPVINKYYIMDLAPGRSLVEYYVAGGQQVFMMSWRNPAKRHRNWGFDEYGAAIVEALDALESITGRSRANVFATCSGGILASMVLSHLAAIGQGSRVPSLSLGVTVLDQSYAGFASAVSGEEAAEAAIRSSESKGYLDGAAMAEVFAWLRPTDLVWRYWVNNYLEGRSPAPFDVLFWNADTTRMTAALHRDMVLLALHNKLVTPGAATMLGTPVDLGKVEADSYVMGGIADHICPWQATYRSAALLGGRDNRYVLSSSGHIASLVNPPTNKKASNRIADVDPSITPDEWMERVENTPGSWWPDHLEWLTARSGDEVDAPQILGAAGFEPLAPAPGTYVLEN
ncbi:PHA/PHB synthase family protein [Tsukamurella soli]|uniref:Alpha/beta fold hydrolase n=1 Tax=Tsukamurella soli TaxID=644556 RepID=A0ABP8JFI1_9ACTN